MATLTLVAASPHALKYEYAADNSGATQAAAKSLAQLRIDAKTAGPGPSPLSALLDDSDNNELAALDESATVSIYTTPTVATATPCFTSKFSSLNGGELAVNGTGLTDGDKAFVEVRFHHTLVR